MPESAAVKGISPKSRFGLLIASVILITAMFLVASVVLDEGSLTIKIGELEVSIDTKNLKASAHAATIIEENRYVNSSLGFSFTNPEKGPWSAPQYFDSAEELLRAKAISGGVIGDTGLNPAISVHPYGEMFMKLKAVRLTSGNPKSIELTRDTSNPMIRYMIRKFLEMAEMQEEDVSEDDIKTLVYESMPFKSFEYSDEFIVQAFDKSYLEDGLVNPTLPNFFANFSALLGLAMDELVADERSILAGGQTIMENVTVDGEVRDVTMYRLMLITESENFFYLTEIGFSPDLSASRQTWEQLSELLQSFRVLTPT